jgi:ADP-heptose:LPS heptosyltransferase
VLETKLTLAPWLSYRQKERVERFIGGKPFILLHTRGYSWPDKKDFTPELEAETQLALLQQTEAEIVLLDQRKVAVRLPHPRVRLAPTDTALPELWYLISRASVLIGCDSGPLHLARLTETPAIGCWFGLNPETYLLSRTKTTNLLQPSAREIVGAVLNTV